MILDDNFFFQKILEELITRSADLELHSTVDDKQSVQKITEVSPDIIFFDPAFVDMSPEEILNMYPYNPMLVILSANEKFASEVFESHVTDMLDKSTLTSDRFQVTLKKIRSTTLPTSISAWYPIFPFVFFVLLNLSFIFEVFYLKVSDYELESNTELH